jgi:hypothetical protein
MIWPRTLSLAEIGKTWTGGTYARGPLPKLEKHGPGEYMRSSQRVPVDLREDLAADLQKVTDPHKPVVCAQNVN